jgi:hypothetical protein
MLWFKRKNLRFNVKLGQLSIGRRLAQSMYAELNAFITERFAPTYACSLDFLRGQLDKARNRDYAPPIIVASIELKVFQENVIELEGFMRQEIQNAFHKWLALGDKMGLRTNLQRLIDSRVRQIQDSLTDAGWQLFADKADALKEADAAWRAANLELYGKFSSAYASIVPSGAVS